MAIFTNHIINANVVEKKKEIQRQVDSIISQLTNSKDQLQNFTAFMFSHPELFDREDIMKITAEFEPRRNQIDSLTAAINAIGKITSPDSTAGQVATNVASFISSINYDDVEYSAQFND